jgi:thiamine biosynthesis lipoprotein
LMITTMMTTAMITMRTMMTITTKAMTTKAKAADGDTLNAGHWQQHSFRAMNTDVHAWAYTSTRRSLIREVEDLFRYFEQLLSRFRPASELSRLNDYDGPMYAAGEDLFAAVEAALWAAQQTDGVFDPTILPYLEKAGYDRTFDAIENRRPLTAEELHLDGPDAGPDRRTGFDYRDVRLDPRAHLIGRPPGLRLDLGGMGKGWTVDRVVDALCGVELSAGPFMVNAGGDIYAYGWPNDGRGWEIHLAFPLDPRLKLATLTLSHHAVATSTIARRRWIKDGCVQHHLIDPRTGRPAAAGAISVSVVAGRVFTAEVYAKAALIMGAERGLAFLESLPDVEGLIYAADRSVRMTTGMGQLCDRLDPSGCE